MTIEEIKKLRQEMIKFCEKEGMLKPSVESMYDKILTKLDEERRTHEWSLLELSGYTEIDVDRLLYLFGTKHQDDKMTMDELLKLCIALHTDIGLVPIWLCGCGVSFGRKDNKSVTHV